MVWFEKKLGKGNSQFKNTSELKYSYFPTKIFSLSITGKIILTNILFFIAFYIILFILGTDLENYLSLLENVALRPMNILKGTKLWTFFSHMFMHANLTHLMMNMLSLAFIGSFVEKLLGGKRFFRLYVIGGIVSAIFFVTLAGFFGDTPIGEKLFGDPLTFAVGASGAIFALGGLLAMLTPKMKVLVFFIVPMQMWLAMTSFLMIFWILSYFGGIPIGNSAHLGGLLTGLAYGIYLKKKYPLKTKMISRFFS
jgi:membrane associated rhomboid family serine protease